MAPASVERIERNRYTWGRIHAVDGVVEKDPEYQQLLKPSRFSLRQKTAKDWMEDAEKQFALRQSIYRRELHKLVGSADGRLDLQMLELYDRFQGAIGTNQEEARDTLQHSLASGSGSLPLIILG